MTALARRLTGIMTGAVITAGCQLALNRNLFINPSTNQLIDPWIYSGYFLTLPAQMQRFPETYYGSRLSVLVPGFLAHRFFPPLTANYILHIGLFLILLAATYSLMRRGAGAGIGLLATVVMAWNPTVLSALSWDYVDGFGITVFVLTLAWLEASLHARRHAGPAAFAAGVLTGCLVSANIFLVVLMPILALFAAMRTGVDRWRVAIRVGTIAALGFVMTLAVFSLINVRLGGPWQYLAPQWREGRTLVAARNPWQLDGYGWVAYATWLVLPLTAAMGALAACARWWRTREAVTFALTMQVVLLATAAEWLAVQIWSTPVLQISYYSSYLAPLAVLALTLQWRGVVDRFEDAARLTLAASAIFAVVAWTVLADPQRFWVSVEPAWLVNAFAAMPSIGAEHSLAAGATAIGAASALIAIVLLQGRGSAPLRWVGFVGALALSYVAVPQFWQPAAGPSAPALFETTALAHRFISQQTGGRKPRVWYHLTPQTPAPFKSIASTYLWGYVLINEDMPSLTPEQAASLTPGARVVLLVQTPEDAERARAPLRQFGFDYEMVTHQTFGDGPTGVSVVIVDLVKARA